jgi:hypothetical protein
MEDKGLVATLRGLARHGPIENLPHLRSLFRRISQATPIQTEEIARSLLELMQSDSRETSLRAEQLLGCLNVEAIDVVAAAAQRDDPLWRKRVLSVLWRLANETVPEYMRLKGAAVLANLRPLLDDRFVYEYSAEEDLRDEPEYQELRICDDAYLLITKLQGTYVENYFFAEMSYDDRDEVIREAVLHLSMGPHGTIA